MSAYVISQCMQVLTGYARGCWRSGGESRDSRVARGAEADPTSLSCRSGSSPRRKGYERLISVQESQAATAFEFAPLVRARMTCSELASGPKDNSSNSFSICRKWAREPLVSCSSLRTKRLRKRPSCNGSSSAHGHSNGLRALRGAHTRTACLPARDSDSNSCLSSHFILTH